MAAKLVALVSSVKRILLRLPRQFFAVCNAIIPSITHSPFLPFLHGFVNNAFFALVELLLGPRSTSISRLC